MKKKVLISALILLVIALLITIAYNQQLDKKPTIAVVTTLSHPALESVKNGFTQMVKTKLPGFSITYYNAEGNLQQAHLIAQQIAQDPSVAAIFAIGTLAAQALAKAEKTRPIIIGAVTDPKRVLPAQNNNLAGLSDTIDAHFQIETLLKLSPKLKTISLLYSPHETNSESMVKQLSHEAETRGVKITLFGVHEPQQIATASLRACQKSEMVLIPLDNQLVASMPVVIKATKTLPCAIVTSNESPLHQGATIAFGVDYEKSGKSAADLLIKVLNKEISIKDIGFIDPKTVDLFINDRVVKEKQLILETNAVNSLIHANEGDKL